MDLNGIENPVISNSFQGGAPAMSAMMGMNPAMQMPTQQSSTDYTQMNNVTGVASDASREMVSTLQSVKDTVAMSFQTLNLTLGSLNNTMRYVATAVSPSAQGARMLGMQYVPSSSDVTMPGSLSAPLQSYLGNADIRTLMSSPKPFNVSNMEWGTNVAQERGYRLGSMGFSGATTFGSSLAEGAIGAGFAKLATSQLGKIPGIGTSLASFAAKHSIASGILLGGPAAMLAGAALAPITDDIMDEGQAHIRDIASIKRMSTRFGNEFTTNESADISKYIRKAANKELYQTGDNDARLGEYGYRELLMTGMQKGLFHGTSSQQLKDQMDNAGRVVKFLAGVMGSKDIKEAIDSVIQLKGMGVNLSQNPNFATDLGLSAFKYGALSGMSGSDMMQYGMAGGQAFQQQGYSGMAGIIPMMRNMTMASELEKRHIISTTDMSIGGGAQGIGQNVTSAMAAMTRSGQIGSVMLAAGMRDGQFDQAKFDKAMKGGYFGALGEGTRSIADPLDYASFDNNKEAMVSQLALEGNLQQNLVKMVRAAMKNMPIQGKSLTQRREMIRAYTKQLLQSMGQQADPGTVKVITEQVMHGNTIDAMDSNGKAQLDRSYNYQLKERNGFFSAFRRTGEGFERLGSSIVQNTTRALGRWGAEGILNMFDDTYGAVPEFGTGEATKEVMENYFNDLKSGRSLSQKYNNANFNSSELNAAYQLSQSGSEGGLDSSFVFGNSLWNRMKGSKYSSMMERATYGRFKGMYDALSAEVGGNGISSGVQAWSAKNSSGQTLRDSLGLGNMSYSQFARQLSDTADSKRGIFHLGNEDTVGLYEQAMADVLKENNSRVYDENLKRVKSMSGYSKLESDLKSSTFYRDNLGMNFNGDVDSGALQTILGDENNRSAAELAKKYGMTQGEMTLAISENQGWNKTNTLNFQALNKDTKSMLQAIAAHQQKANGDISERDMNMARMVGYDTPYSSGQAKAFRDVGITDEYLKKMLQSKTGSSEMEAMGNILNALSVGDQQTVDQYIGKISSKEGLALVDQWAGEDASDLQRKAKKVGVGDLRNLGNDFAALLSQQGNATAADQMKYLYGGKAKDIISAIKQGKGSEAFSTIMGMGDEDAQVTDVKAQLREMQKAYIGGKDSWDKYSQEHYGLAGSSISFDDAATKEIAQSSASAAFDKDRTEKEEHRSQYQYQDAIVQCSDGGVAFKVVQSKAPAEEANIGMKETRSLSDKSTNSSVSDTPASTLTKWVLGDRAPTGLTSSDGNTSKGYNPMAKYSYK